MRRALLLAAAIGALSLIPASAQFFQLPDGVNFQGRIQSSGAPPTLSSCGASPTVQNGSNATAGQVVANTTSCTITLPGSWNHLPFIIAQDQTTAADSAFTTALTSGTVTIVFGTVVSGDKLNYWVVGQPGL